MADDSIKLEVVTPQRLVLSTMVAEVTAPSVKGEFGVLPGHRPLLAALEHGRVQYVEGNQVKRGAAAPGYAQVGPDRVVLLIEEWESGEDIDLEQAQQQLAEAEAKVKDMLGQEDAAEYQQVQELARWAAVRVEVAEQQRQV